MVDEGRDQKTEGASAGGGGDSKISETFRKVLTMGMGAAFMTEESLRQIVRESKLPKDFPPLKTLLDGALRAKQDLVEKVGDDVIRMLRKLDWSKELTRFAETHKFTVKAELQVNKREDEAKSPDLEKGS